MGDSIVEMLDKVKDAYNRRCQDVAKLTAEIESQVKENEQLRNITVTQDGMMLRFTIGDSGALPLTLHGIKVGDISIHSGQYPRGGRRRG